MSIPLIYLGLSRNTNIEDYYDNVFIDSKSSNDYEYDDDHLIFDDAPLKLTASSAAVKSDWRHRFTSQEKFNFYSESWTLEYWWKCIANVYAHYGLVGIGNLPGPWSNQFYGLTYSGDASSGFGQSRLVWNHSAWVYDANTHILVVYLNGKRASKTLTLGTNSDNANILIPQRTEGPVRICDICLFPGVLYTENTIEVPTSFHTPGSFVQFPNKITGTYLSANGLTYCYRTTFKSTTITRTSNVVNYETSRKLGVLLEILIINILYNNVIFCTLHSLLRY